jgi:signal transduction histidine kinase
MRWISVLRRLRRPLPAAMTLALLYLAIGVAYIHLSSRRAAEIARTIGDLARLEIAKGQVFILTTAAMLFVLTLALFVLLERENRRLNSLESELAESESRRLPGLFASTVAHDLGNILQVALLHAEALEKGGASDSPANRRELADALRRLTSLAEGLREHGRRGAPAPSATFAVDNLLDDIAELARQHAALRGCRLETALGAGAEHTGDRALFARAVLNLLINAGEATPGGTVRLASRRDGAELVVEVHDDGPGVAGEVRDEIFRPYFTTKRTGTGLGLVPLRALARADGGSAEVAASPLGGACFRLRLPLGA